MWGSDKDLSGKGKSKVEKKCKDPWSTLVLSKLSTRIVQSDKFLTSHRAQTSSKNYRVLALEGTWDIVYLYRQCIAGMPSVVSKMYMPSLLEQPHWQLRISQHS